MAGEILSQLGHRENREGEANKFSATAGTDFCHMHEQHKSQKKSFFFVRGGGNLSQIFASFFISAGKCPCGTQPLP